MLGPLLFDNRGAIVKKFVLQKKISNKNFFFPKKPFSQKKFLLNMNFKNDVKQKRCTRVILLGAEEISTRKNQNWRCGIHFEKKKLKSHFRDPKKAFFSISYFEKCFCMQSLPTANCSLVWQNFCTPYYTGPHTWNVHPGVHPLSQFEFIVYI